MFERLSRSWELVKASAAVLRADKELLVFPLISGLAMLAVLASFALPVIGVYLWQGPSAKDLQISSVAGYAVAFLFYLSQYFVIFFFNAALVGAAMIRLEGGDPTVAEGLRIARSKVGVILGYALTAATVGLLLRMVQERVGFIGRIVVGLLGAGWSIATYLVVPVLVAKDIGPIDAIKESGRILKHTWGENLVGQAGLGVAFTLIQVLVVVVGVALTIVMAIAGNVALVLLAIALLIVAVLLTFLVHSALAGIYAAALYRFATKGDQNSGFAPGMLQSAFVVKP